MKHPGDILGRIDHKNHYANAFCLLSERCFRLVLSDDGTGHPTHCPNFTLWRGRFKDGAGRWHTVEACDDHRADLDAVQRIPVRA